MLDGLIYNSDFSLEFYIWGDIYYQGMNFQGEEWLSVSGVERSKKTYTWIES